MKIPSSIVSLLNTQIHAEFESAFLYLSMSAFMHEKGYNGFACWLKIQAEEEKKHAMKIFDYMIERNETPVLQSFSSPLSDWTSVACVWEAVYAHECLITTMIYGIYDKALSEKDFGSVHLMNWFIGEQIEEEERAFDLLSRIKVAKEDAFYLHQIDMFCATRRYDAVSCSSS